MNAERPEIDQLIVQSFSGEINPDAKIILEDWISSNEGNRIYFKQQIRLLELLALQEKMQMVNERRAFRKVSNQLFKRQKPGILQYLQRVAAILLIPVVLFSVYEHFIKKQTPHPKMDAETVYNTVETPLGMRSNLTLPDGTKVWLNAGTKLSYPVPFKGRKRSVSLIGEAYFEVKKDVKHPFFVTTEKMSIIVTGTSFNCNAYPENEQVQTTLVEGEVTLVNNSATVMETIKPGELATFMKSNQTITKTETNLQKYIAWKHGKLMFRDDKMIQVVEKLERWYNVDFQIEDEEISNYIYTATFIDESLDQVLKMLSLSAPIRYTVSERKKQDDQTFAKQTVRLYRK